MAPAATLSRRVARLQHPSFPAPAHTRPTQDSLPSTLPTPTPSHTPRRASRPRRAARSWGRQGTPAPRRRTCPRLRTQRAGSARRSQTCGSAGTARAVRAAQSASRVPRAALAARRRRGLSRRWQCVVGAHIAARNDRVGVPVINRHRKVVVEPQRLFPTRHRDQQPARSAQHGQHRLSKARRVSEGTSCEDSAVSTTLA